ncbi:hypothetical protein J2Z49_001518 [Desulfofundulus luciae]|uniref:Group II intron maturase-specific domain-containing protein n=1 Tax=Desulfofundulus luciae TaxID=74702 RepID=A0ABU0B2A8_9FIRM|nr:group II intron maturase-specific domain-containing protein [Desulfofundulus luciae]MDQ0286404.1 hypothetical protein [Desulfofundulus luciae]
MAVKVRCGRGSTSLLAKGKGAHREVGSGGAGGKATARGWVGYFALAETPGPLREIEGCLMRRLRACLWKQWKRVRTRIRL